jgi:hypothetical protein
MVVFQQPSKWDSIALLRSHPHLEFHGIPNSDGYQFFCVSVAFFSKNVLFHFSSFFSFWLSVEEEDFCHYIHPGSTHIEPGNFYSILAFYYYSFSPSLVFNALLCERCITIFTIESDETRDVFGI